MPLSQFLASFVADELVCPITLDFQSNYQVESSPHFANLVHSEVDLDVQFTTVSNYENVLYDSASGLQTCDLGDIDTHEC